MTLPVQCIFRLTADTGRPRAEDGRFSEKPLLGLEDVADLGIASENCQSVARPENCTCSSCLRFDSVSFDQQNDDIVLLFQLGLCQCLILERLGDLFEDDIGDRVVSDIIHQQNRVYLVLLHDFSGDSVQHHVDPLSYEACPDQPDDQSGDRKRDDDTQKESVELGGFEGKEDVHECGYDGNVKNISS